MLVGSNWDSGIVGPGDIYIGDVGVSYGILDAAIPVAVTLYGRLERGRSSEHRSFPEGVDFPLGAGMFLSAATDGWADANLGVRLTYQVI